MGHFILIKFGAKFLDTTRWKGRGAVEAWSKKSSYRWWRHAGQWEKAVLNLKFSQPLRTATRADKRMSKKRVWERVIWAYMHVLHMYDVNLSSIDVLHFNCKCERSVRIWRYWACFGMLEIYTAVGVGLWLYLALFLEEERKPSKPLRTFPHWLWSFK